MQARIRTSIEEYMRKNAIEAPADTNKYSQYVPDSPSSIDLNHSNIRSIIWATGFRIIFDWVKLPIMDNIGHPIQTRGISKIPGLHFLGLNWMHTWGSGRFFHVGKDTEFCVNALYAQ